MKNALFICVFTIFLSLILTLTVRGILGNPDKRTLDNIEFKEGGPLELSPERGRFALTFSLVEDKSFIFDLPVARFATPDLGYNNGKYVSLFAPGVSFLTIPGYLIGRELGSSQIGSFLVISIFAVFNALIIRSIAQKLGANKFAASIGSLVFLFASPAFSYASTLYQHHISTFLVLLSLFSLIKFKSIWALSIVWFCAALSLSVDYPNLFLMSPIVIFALGKVIDYKALIDGFKVKINFKALLTMTAVILPVLFFLWTNFQSYGNPYQLAGTIKSVEHIDEAGIPHNSKWQPNDDKDAIGFFNTRNLMSGLNVELFSLDRGIVVYSPIMLVALFGAIILYKKNHQILSLFAAIIGVNILLYGMWGDPWGGWAFGSRYLIPSYALMAILASVALTKHKGMLFSFIFTMLFGYSILINTIGALTSNANPPKNEAINLEKVSGREEKYSIDRNVEFLNKNDTKSIAYKLFFSKYILPWQYYHLIVGLIMITFFGLFVFHLYEKGKD